ncbi:MAG: ATP-binding protein, partial [SAR202 cluster bacterium]|nr:ATP-binding protein [SAR202 cluster bacterium]
MEQWDVDRLRQHTDASPGPYAMLAVHDNGIGMRDDVKNRVFEPFFTTKGVGKGTGLGLSTCYGIVKQNGGFIKVKSEQGQGASFEAFFPAAKGAESSPKAEPDVNELPTGTETVLVVEDEPLVREIATSTLHRQGYNMLVAGNGLDALRIVDQSALGAISLVVTDVVGHVPSSGVRGVHPQIVLSPQRQRAQ